MSKQPTFHLSGDNAIEELLQVKKGITKIRAAGKAYAKAPVRVPTSSVAQASKKRVVDDDAAFFSMEDVHLSFPMTAHAYTEFTPHSSEVPKLLWHEDESTFRQLGSETIGQTGIANIFKGLQSVIYLTKKVGELEDQVKQLTSDKTGLNKEVRALKEKIKELEVVEVECKALLKSRDADAERLKVALKEVDALRANMEKNCRVAALQTEVRLREQLYLDLKAGKTEEWDGQKICAAVEKLRKMEAAEEDETADTDEHFDDVVTLDFVGGDQGGPAGQDEFED